MKYFVSVVLVLCMVLMIVGAVSAAQGTWKSYASDGSGSLTGGSQFAYYKTRIGGVQQPEVKVNANWSLLSLDSKAGDFSSTTGGSWNVADPGANWYQRTAITPSSFDQSRGIVMAKIKVNSAGAVNGAFGFSTANGYGLQLGLRGSALRVRSGEGNTLSGYSDPADVNQTADYRVYALSWIGNVANVWYSNGNDWSSDPGSWTRIMTDYAMAAGTSTINGGNVNGLVLFTAASANAWNGNIAWMAHSTYDNIDGQVTPWDFNPATDPPVVTPEPSSLLALATGLFGFAGFATRRRK